MIYTFLSKEPRQIKNKEKRESNWQSKNALWIQLGERLRNNKMLMLCSERVYSHVVNLPHRVVLRQEERIEKDLLGTQLWSTHFCPGNKDKLKTRKQGVKLAREKRFMDTFR